ncbi:MAG: Isoprenylcysteine carboxyl methyltransferase (ICMT) family, partial [bacterium]
MTTAPLDLQLVQRIRKVAVLAALIVLIGLSVISQSIGGIDGPWHEWVERTGLAAIVFSIVGRAWCSL